MKAPAGGSEKAPPTRGLALLQQKQKGSKTSLNSQVRNEQPDVDKAREALIAAREAQREGREVEGVEALATWLNAPNVEKESGELADVIQAMVALGCWLCNAVATRHLHKRQVARAFTFTRTCQRWLALRRGEPDEMWLKLKFDCYFNGAELAQTSGDTARAVLLLRECAKLQAAMQEVPAPEAVYICLAEVHLKCGDHEAAASAAQSASDSLKSQEIGGDERKRYSLVFSLALEQSALVVLCRKGQAVASERALRCLPDAEATWFVQPEGSEGPGDDACRVLLGQMRKVHHDLLTSIREAQDVQINKAMQATVSSQKSTAAAEMLDSAAPAPGSSSEGVQPALAQ